MPLLEKRCAQARPIILVAPVIKTTLSFNDVILTKFKPKARLGKDNLYQKRGAKYTFIINYQIQGINIMAQSITRDTILADMETIYHLALAEGKLNVALHVKELQGKAVGLFHQSHLPIARRISEMSEDQLTEFMARLEDLDPALKQTTPDQSATL